MAKKTSIVNDEKIYIEKEERLNIDFLRKSIDYLKEQMKTVDLSIKNNNMEIDNLKLKIALVEKNIVNLSLLKKEKQNDFKILKEEYDNYIKEIGEKYKINGEDWGYDPDTGEIAIKND